MMNTADLAIWNRRVTHVPPKKADNYFAFLHFARALIAFRAAGLFG
jgi:hypothetical protein